MTNNNEMPNEIYLFRNSNGGLELGPAPDSCDWLVNIKYIRAALTAQPAEREQDVKCPTCGGVADNGHDREIPPNYYECKACELSSQPKQPDVNAELLEKIESAKDLCKAIVEGYPNPEINHVDFRVQVTKWAQDFLDDNQPIANAEQKGGV